MGYLQVFILAAAVVPPDAAPWTLHDVLARARTHAPALAEARAAVGEAAGRRRAASQLLSENPEVELAAGRREGSDERDLELAVSQRIEIAGQRGLRKAAARAGMEQADAALEHAVRSAAAEAAAAFYRVLHAQERHVLAVASEDLAARVLHTVQKRYDAGDVAALDLNLARIARGRARAETASAEAERIARVAELRSVLGMTFDEPLALAGDLRQRPAVDAGAISTDWATRPEIAAAAAEKRQSEAESKLARRESWPGLGVSARYEREEGTPVVWGGVTLSLPLFARGQQERAVAAARVERSAAALETARRAVETSTKAGIAAQTARRLAIDTFEQVVLPGVEDNEGLSRRSFEVGQISLAELLLVRREGLEARAAYLDALLAAALEEATLLVHSGGGR